MKVKTNTWGELECKTPGIAIVFEIVLYWTQGGEDIAQLARACAAALAVCIDRPGLPKYKPALHKPANFGHDALEQFLKMGESSELIFSEGTKALQHLAKMLPSDEGTEDAQDFLDSPRQEDSPA